MQASNLIQKLYIGFYGRPADPGGLAYWTKEMEEEESTTSVVEAFVDSRETEKRGLLEDPATGAPIENEQLIDNIYQNLFGRNADDGGMAFYMNKLDSGEFNRETLVYNIIEGAKNEDPVVLENKQTVADVFTQTVEQKGLEYDSEHLPEACAIVRERILDVSEAKGKMDELIDDLIPIEPLPPYFEVAAIDGDVVVLGETADVTATIINTGDLPDTQDINLMIGYFDPLGMPRVYDDDQELSLPDGGFEDVTFTLEIEEGAVAPGRYDPKISTDNHEKTADDALIILGEDEPMVEIAAVAPVFYEDEAVTVAIDLWNAGEFEDENVYIDIYGIDGQARVEVTEPGDYEIPLAAPVTEGGEFKIFAFENADDEFGDHLASCPGIQNDIFLSKEEAVNMRALDGTTSIIYTDPLHSFDGKDGHLDSIDELETGFTMFDLQPLDLESEETQMLDITEDSLEEAAEAAAEELQPGHHGIFEHEDNTYLYANTGDADTSEEGDLMVEILGTSFQLTEDYDIAF